MTQEKFRFSVKSATSSSAGLEADIMQQETQVALYTQEHMVSCYTLECPCDRADDSGKLTAKGWSFKYRARGITLGALVANALTLIRVDGYENAVVTTDAGYNFEITATVPLGIPKEFKRSEVKAALATLGFANVDKLHSVTLNLEQNRATVQDGRNVERINIV